jgi:hypothetical protein
MEEWRDIRGYEGLYQVSNEGRVRSLDRVIRKINGRQQTYKGRILSPIKHKCSKQQEGTYYNHYYLTKDGKQKWFEVHRLVAEAFIPNPHAYTVVHHKNHNPQDNRAENLEWINNEEHNAIHQTDRITAVVEKLSKTVFQYDLYGKLVRIWSSIHEIARELGYSNGTISVCCNGGYFDKKRNKWVDRLQYKGYKWSYEPL